MFSYACYSSRRGLWNESRWLDWSCKYSEYYFWRLFVLRSVIHINFQSLQICIRNILISASASIRCRRSYVRMKTNCYAEGRYGLLHWNTHQAFASYPGRSPSKYILKLFQGWLRRTSSLWLGTCTVTHEPTVSKSYVPVIRNEGSGREFL